MRGRAERAGGVTSPSAPSRAAWRVPIDRSRRDGAIWPGHRACFGLFCPTVRQGWWKLAPRALGDVCFGVIRYSGSPGGKGRGEGNREARGAGSRRREGRKRATIHKDSSGVIPPLVNSRVTASRPSLCYFAADPALVLTETKGVQTGYHRGTRLFLAQTVGIPHF